MNGELVTEMPRLEMPFLDEMVAIERTAYPLCRLLFLSDEQLSVLIASPHFLDRDASYLSPLDSSVTLPVMKTFRVHKPVARPGLVSGSTARLAAVDRLGDPDRDIGCTSAGGMTKPPDDPVPRGLSPSWRSCSCRSLLSRLTTSRGRHSKTYKPNERRPRADETPIATSE